MRFLRQASLPILSLLLGACANLSLTPAISTATPTSPAIPPTQAPGTPSQEPMRLDVWLPPVFSPLAETGSGRLLATRLRTFEGTNPSMSVEVRIRDEQGPGGLLETLSSASLAAPAALPDVIALNPSALNTAALKGLVVSLNGLMPLPASPDWYDYAAAAAMVDEGYFGLPFASDAEAFAVRTSSYAATPRNWADLQLGSGPFAFPAADLTASFTMAQYLALGGELTNSDGLPSIAPKPLQDILAFYVQARTAGVLPMRIQEEETTQEIWADFEAGLIAGAHSPISHFLQTDIPGSTLVPIPTRDGQGIALTQTWTWAIVTRDPSRQAAASQLIAWLSAPEFLGPWTQRLGLLPPTRESLDQWPDEQWRAIATRISLVGYPRPSDEILSIVGPVMQAAVEAVLSGMSSPAEAAREAAASLAAP